MGPVTLLLDGKRLLTVTGGLPEVEYLLFDSGEVTLRASDIGTIREVSYQTRVRFALERMERAGLFVGFGEACVSALRTAAVLGYARGPIAQKLVHSVMPGELLDGYLYDAASKTYEGFFLDLTLLARDLGRESAARELQALALFERLRMFPGDTELTLETEGGMDTAPPGGRSFRRVQLPGIEGLLGAIQKLAAEPLEARLRTPERLPEEVIAYFEAFESDARRLATIRQVLGLRSLAPPRLDSSPPMSDAVTVVAPVPHAKRLPKVDVAPMILLAPPQIVGAGDERALREDGIITPSGLAVTIPPAPRPPMVPPTVTAPAIAATRATPQATPMVEIIPAPSKERPVVDDATNPSLGTPHGLVGASLPPMAGPDDRLGRGFEEPRPPRRIPSRPIRTTLEVVENLSLPPGLHGGAWTPPDGLPKSVLDARITFTHWARDLARQYRTDFDTTLKTDMHCVELIQARLHEQFPDGRLKTQEDLAFAKKHGALLAELLIRTLGAEWTDISPSEIGYWELMTPPETRIWPFGRVFRYLSMGTRERDLVSFYLELQLRAEKAPS